MNKIKSKKAELGVGTMIIMFIGIIVALVLLTASAGEVGKSTSTDVLSNGLYTAPASGSCIDLKGQELLSAATVTNRTSGTAKTVNFTIAEGISTVDGLKRIRFCTTGASAGGGDAWSGLAFNVSYTYGPEGYADDSGARSILGIVILLAAIAVVVFVVYPAVKEKFGTG